MTAERARFWRLEDWGKGEGEYFYVDPQEIAAVNRYWNTHNDDVDYVITLRSGVDISVSDEDGQKLMKWAESLSESLSESLPDINNPGSWR